MSPRQLVLILAVGTVVVLGFRHSRDPHRTALPFGSTDLSSVQAELARLPADERTLVEDYVKRSNGDVLPAQFADPDDPLTARTFGEAIELQRAWVERMKVEDARMADLRAERDARLAPLRAIADARVVKAQIVGADGLPVAGVGGNFVTRIRIQNLGNESIVGLSGSLKARDRDEYLPLDLCWIDLGSQQTLAAGASTEFHCGRGRGGASDQQRAYVENPPGRFIVEWEPRHIKLASGRELDSGL
ncbi:MAG: hypothetical protein IPO66_13640 [Rhodanobacteraceae bacterium]|nr:hypothetical protein [Rhodanobacteraceae bacterium]